MAERNIGVGAGIPGRSLFAGAFSSGLAERRLISSGAAVTDRHVAHCRLHNGRIGCRQMQC